MYVNYFSIKLKKIKYNNVFKRKNREKTVILLTLTKMAIIKMMDNN